MLLQENLQVFLLKDQELVLQICHIQAPVDCLVEAAKLGTVFQASPKFTDLNCHAVRECVVNLI
jgi:hypothetical protein